MAGGIIDVADTAVFVIADDLDAVRRQWSELDGQGYPPSDGSRSSSSSSV